MLPSIPITITISESNPQAAPADQLTDGRSSPFGLAFNQINQATYTVDTPNSFDPDGNVLPPGGIELPGYLEAASEFAAGPQALANYEVDVSRTMPDGRLTEPGDLNALAADGTLNKNLGPIVDNPIKTAAAGEWGHRVIQHASTPTIARQPVAESQSPTVAMTSQGASLTAAQLSVDRQYGTNEAGNLPPTTEIPTSTPRQQGQMTPLNDIQSRIPDLPHGDGNARIDRELRVEPIVNALAERGDVVQKSDLQLLANSVTSTAGVQPNSRESMSGTRLELPLTTSIDRPVLDKAWGTELQEKVLWLTSRNIQNAEIRLNPAELGPIRIQVSVEDEAATVLFTAQHNVTREAIELALPRLREMLSDHGLSLAGTSVNDTDDGGLHEDDRTRDDDSDDVEVQQSQIDDAGEHHGKRIVTSASLVDTFA